ncbi:DeoR/GlpR family DNA-binding transcription regulator [Sphingomonas sp. Leaf10]|uniref:DeoR/GlpR family DNA-binding transcription regulator n=1 Tax=Sphingomonas sp. Leaf10 TaxID=1735676 RepID=UPI0007002043|nr:DeoR/GlpR family DNA-binding transcription regulator [Sphingomonas sp. Leaf10]KQM31764.1 DeoR family transcriptional regulator [Sphingomonas sp. Leaf10]
MKVPDVVAARHAAILDAARRTGSVSVDELAEQLAVTPQTIRKDLNILARQSMLTRTHGGAVVISGTDNLAYPERRAVAAPTKAAIGAAAAALVPNGASLFINIGTTTEAIARSLVDHRDLMVITNNLNVVDILGGRPGIEVIAAGGRVRASVRAVVGALAIDFIRGFRVDMALIGASALDPDGTFLNFDVDEVRVSQTIIRHARRVLLAIDATKVGRAAPVRVGDMADVDYLVTDADDAALVTACADAGTEMIRPA